MIETNSINSFLDTNPYVEQAEPEDNLGRDEFLTLFLTQLNNQDPLNPMDSTQFTSQLAEYSSLEQLFNVNDNLEGLQDVQTNSNQFQALDLIGKEINLDGDMISFAEGETSSGGFTLSSAADCTAIIYDENGDSVREISLGMLEAGPHSFEWDGRNEDGETVDQDVYGFGIMATTESGESLSVETQVKGIVDKVELSGDDPIVYIGDIYLYLSQVSNISLPTSTAETDIE